MRSLKTKTNKKDNHTSSCTGLLLSANMIIFNPSIQILIFYVRYRISKRSKVTVLPELPYYSNYYYFYYYPGVKTGEGSQRGKRWRRIAKKDQQENKVKVFKIFLSVKTMIQSVVR